MKNIELSLDNASFELLPVDELNSIVGGWALRVILVMGAVAGAGLEVYELGKATGVFIYLFIGLLIKS